MRERARATPHNKENQERGKGEKKKKRKKKGERKKLAHLTLPFTLADSPQELPAIFKECKTLLKEKAR